MASYALLSLRLHAPLAYHGLENPPLAGLPMGGEASLPCPDGVLRGFPLGQDLAEGEEELFAFDSEQLVAFDPDEGPRILSPLPAPRFYGRGAAGKGCASCPGCAGASHGDSPSKGDSALCGEAERHIPAGNYAFLQFRPADLAELEAGLEFFAREAWWQGKPVEGPYLVRRVKEDGKLATQILRASEA